MQIAYLGMGIMGSAMASNLAKAGHKVRVWNRSPGREGSAKAEAAGCTKCDTIAKAVQGCEMVFTCVSDVRDVEQVLLGPGGVSESAAPDTLVIDTATIGPAAAAKINQMLLDKGIQFLDAPVTGGDVGAVNGTLTIMVGGRDADFQRALPVLNAIGKTIRHCGPSGSGQALKLSNQILCAVNLIAVSEAFSLARQFGLDEGMLPEVLGTGAGGSWSLQNLGPRIIKDDFAPGFRIKDMLKDLRLVQENSQASYPINGDQEPSAKSNQKLQATTIMNADADKPMNADANADARRNTNADTILKSAQTSTDHDQSAIRLPGTELARKLFEQCALTAGGVEQGTQAMIKSYRKRC
jgi:3-hydroxyisobutyrate dehydrogenase